MEYTPMLRFLDKEIIVEDPNEIMKDSPPSHSDMSSSSEAHSQLGYLEEPSENPRVQKESRSSVSSDMEDDEDSSKESKENKQGKEKEKEHNDHSSFAVQNILEIKKNESLNGYFNKNIDLIKKTLSEGKTDPTKVVKEIPAQFMKNLPPRDPTFDYKQQYDQLTIANVVLQEQISVFFQERNELHRQVEKLQAIKAAYSKKKEEPMARHFKRKDDDDDEDKKRQNISYLFFEKKRRHRRTATEIERHYKCPYHPCTKSYGSEGSLNQHIKLKHPQYYYSGPEGYRRGPSSFNTNSNLRSNSTAFNLGLFKK